MPPPNRPRTHEMRGKVWCEHYKWRKDLGDWEYNPRRGECGIVTDNRIKF